MIGGWLEGREVCVCAGPGGVGKTTASAAIALGMAARGRRVAVLTIDPSRRLAHALGMPDRAGEERRVDADVEGELWAMTLDPKRTFDELVERHAPDAATREAILENRIYRELSSAVAGSQEYMAMEKLHELHGRGRYDLIVLDTPPTRNALDFLDAPGRLAAFIDSRSLQVLAGPGRLGLRALGRGTDAALSTLGRVTGVDLLDDLSAFLRSFGGMAAGFRERAEGVNELLAGGRSAFVLVASPRRDALDEAIHFHRRLQDAGLPLAGAVVNRVRPAPPEGEPGEEIERLVGGPLARRVLRSYEDERRLAARERRELERLRRRLRGAPTVEVPRLDGDVHDVRGLALMDVHLFGER